MKLILGSDHAGYPLKRAIMAHLDKKGISYRDAGTVNAQEPASYVHYGQAVAKAVLAKEAELGLVICGTGLGISMTVNKFKGIRGALCCNEYMARMARQHNNANVLALGGRVIGPALGVSIVDAFLEGSFESGGRHQVRVNEMSQVEEEQLNQ